MLDHYFVSESDGALYDVRVSDWSKTPLRRNYCRHHNEINSLADIKATLRQGKFAWPGGYPLYFVTTDGAALSFEAVRQEFSQVAWSHMNDAHDGWHIAGADINYEDNELVCAHTGKRIPSAYGDE